jgi:hypothetical protein
MLSPFRKRKFELLFDHLDLNKDGAIDLTDFTVYAERLQSERGLAPDDATVKRLIDGSRQWWGEMVTRAGGEDKSVSRPEFLAFWEWIGSESMKVGGPPPWVAELCRNIFGALDFKGNGKVDASGYAIWLRAIGSNANASEAFKKLDLNGDGAVTADEMLRLFAQFVLSENPADPGNYLLTGAI